MQLLKFSATWCGPCQAMNKSIKEKPEGFLGIPVEEIDIDDEGNQDLISQYRVRGVPTLVFIDNDGNSHVRSGLMTADQIKNWIGSI